MKPVAASAGHGLARRFISLALAAGLATATAFTMAPAVSAVSPRYVAPVSIPIGDGSSCAAPGYNTIQAAVSDAGARDTIHICGGTPGTPVTYSLDATITVTKDLTFQGDGAASTIIDGTHSPSNVQLFNVTATSASFSGLTLSNGNQASGVEGGLGGAIYADGTVTVTNSTFSGNQASGVGGGLGGAIYANTVTVTNSMFSENDVGDSGGGGGAIYADETVTVTNSTFSRNGAGGDYSGGGAIYADTVTVTNSTFSENQASGVGGVGGAILADTVTVTNSTFSSNSADLGGAIYAWGAVTVTNSTFSENQASGVGVGGGAIYAQAAAGTVTVTNSTFSSNSADLGGAIYADGTSTITNSTFSSNSAVAAGAIYVDVDGTATVTNSILAQEAAGSNLCSSKITSGGGNVSTDSSCGSLTVVTWSSLALGELASNTTGPTNTGPTQTIALGPGSVAIDAGVYSVCNAAPVDGLDQRGVSRRLQGGYCDAGAYEALAPVSTATSTVVASPTSVTADGSTTSTVTVTLKDANGNPVSGKTVTLAKSSGPGSPTISAASGPSNGSGVVTFTVKSTTAGADAFQATDTDDSLVITPTATVTFITVAALDHITLSPSSATITAGGSQAYIATGFAADGNSWDATSSITFTIDGGGSCNGALCTATVAGDYIVTGTDTVGGTILATATLHVDAAGATPTPTPTATPTPTPTPTATSTPTPTPMATSTPTPTPSRAATPPPTSTGVGPVSDGPAGTILFLPVALVAFFGSLLLLVIRQRRRVF